MATVKRGVKSSTKKKGAKKQRKEARIIDISEISVGTGMTPPPLLKESKYPWDTLADKPLPNKDPAHFAINFGEGEEGKLAAGEARTSIYTSGRNYYKKRGMEVTPLVRVTKNDNGEWFVVAFAQLIEEEE